MKKIRSYLSVLLAFVLLALPVASIVAKGEGEPPALRKIYSAFFDESETFRLDKGSGMGNGAESGSTAYYEMIGSGTSRALEMVIAEPKANMFMKFAPSKVAPNDYATKQGDTSPNYYNTRQFTLSVSLSTKTSVASANLQFKSTEKYEVRPLKFNNGTVQTLGGNLLGNLIPGSYLNVSFTLDTEAHTIVYFVDGVKAYEEECNMYNSDKTVSAEHISYGQFYVDNKSENKGASLIIDNLVISYGTLTEANTEYFKEVFKDHVPGIASPTGEETGGETEEGGETEDAVVILRRDFENGSVGTSTLRGSNASVQTEADGNKYLRAVTSSAEDFYYQIHAAEAGIGKYQKDSSTSTSPNYFDSQSLIMLVSLSCGDSSLGFRVESKNPGKTKTTTYLSGSGEGDITTAKSTKIATLSKGSWTNVGIEINFNTDSITYYVDGVKVTEETLSMSDERVSYFNFSIGKFEPAAGAELRIDNLVLGYGTLTEDYFKVPVTFRVGDQTEVKKFSGESFTIPEVMGAKAFMVTVGNDSKVVSAGDTIRLVNEMIFVAIDPRVSLDDGAVFRMDAVTGIRFTGRVNKNNRADLRTLFGAKNVQYGILIAPEDYLTAAEFTHAGLKEAYPTVPLADVPASDWYAIEENEYVIAGSIVSLNPANYGRNFCARAYIAVTMPDGTVSYFYSEFDKAKNSANLYDLAATAYAEADNEEKAAIAPFLKPAE